jgi:predicted phosphoserine aminotransferase
MNKDGGLMRKLFIPGPTEVRKEIREELSKPMISHRGKEFAHLFDEVIPKIQKLLYTKNRIFLSTSSATGLMEAAVRNTVSKKCLNLTCGAFSEKWADITSDNGKTNEVASIEWGKAIKPEMVRKKLETGEFDVVTLVHNETSTGVMNPLEEIAAVIKEFPDVIFCVDAVSSMGGVKIEVDKLGIDVCLASVQKCLALPPGFAIASVSDKAIERAKTVKDRGHYFDFLANFEKYGKKQTLTTPSIPHIYALNAQLDRIFKEGMENRFERHRKMAENCRDWVTGRGFEFFAEKGYESNTVTCISNNKGVDLVMLIEKLAERGKEISNGYGKLKGKTFRIAHMGDIQPSELDELLKDIDEILGVG